MKMREERRTINAGGEFAVRLEVAPGFTWHLVDCPPELAQIGSGYEPVAETTAPVTSRTQAFRFLALDPGGYRLMFARKRDGDADAVEQRRIRVSVR
jgi:hypothetical protein